MLSPEDALSQILAACAPLEVERAPLDDALGRVVAESARAPRDLPPAENSAMDGFALRAGDAPGVLPVAFTAAAGDPPTAELPPGRAARIMTGAPVPEGADAVAMLEDAIDRGGEVELPRAPAPGANIRRRGEDVAAGDVVLPAGAALDPGALALLAALGRADVPVGRRPRVATVSTGDELVPLGSEVGPGQIVNSNAHALGAQIREAGGEPIDLGIAPDRPRETEEAIRRGLAAADVLLTSGGVSVGARDHVKAALERAGAAPAFWKVAIKPGKPLVFARAPEGKLVFGLPGNPVSSMVAFELFVRPALLALQGARETSRPRAPAVLADAYPKKPGRAHYARATLERRGSELRAHISAKQGSGMVSAMALVDALVEIEAEAGDQPAGAEHPALLLRPA